MNILTGDNLRIKDYIIVDWCCMSWCSGESRDHLLIHCGGLSFMDVWNLVSLCLMWSIRRECNNRTFEYLES